MSSNPEDRQNRLRLLECWLPLAQEANWYYGWNYDGPALEALILQAAPRLRHARNDFEARMILWSQHIRNHRARQALRNR